ncbi:MAG: winged helix-turn-helix domain-containing protein [Candidatus Eremiobacteraeota bacterium]|nr:winged helix-turn-helix domain-containing protein [Candidatus Eremiobacteraeota bacterium]
MEAKQGDEQSYAFGPYRVSCSERVLRFDGQPVILAAKAVDVLFVLLAHPDRVISKAELMDSVWPSAYVDEANLTQNIYLLRKLFKQHQSGVSIENVPKQGYRLVVPSLPPPLQPQPARSKLLAAFALACAAVIFVFTLRFGAGTQARALEGNSLREYMLARDYQNSGSQKKLERSIALFTHVIHAEPSSALGYAGLAVSDASLSYYVSDETQQVQLRADAISLARQAVRKDPQSADAYAALGGAEFSIEHDAKAASANFQRALAINPRQLNALVWYGTLLLNQGEVGQSRHLLTQAMGIAPDSSGTIASLAWSDFVGGDFPGAIELSNQQLLAQEQPVLAHMTLANAYLLSGDYVRAGDAIQKLLRDPRTRVQGTALLAQLHAATGHGRQADAELRALDGTTDPRTIGSWGAASIASAYLARGNRPFAMTWLARVSPWERGEISKDPRFVALSHDRAFASWAHD